MAANATIQNVGGARSGASYGSSGCDRSYVVDIKGYAPATSTGTIVSYAGPNTTDAAVCASTRVSAYVFRKSPRTNQYEAVPDRRGSPHSPVEPHEAHLAAQVEACRLSNLRPHGLDDRVHVGGRATF